MYTSPATPYPVRHTSPPTHHHPDSRSQSVNHCTLQTPDTQTPLVPQLYSVHIHEHTDIQTHKVWQSCSVRYSSPPTHHHPDSPGHSVNHCTLQTPDTQTRLVPELYSVHIHGHTDIQTHPVWQSCTTLGPVVSACRVSEVYNG